MSHQEEKKQELEELRVRGKSRAAVKFQIEAEKKPRQNKPPESKRLGMIKLSKLHSCCGSCLDFKQGCERDEGTNRIIDQSDNMLPSKAVSDYYCFLSFQLFVMLQNIWQASH